MRGPDPPSRLSDSALQQADQLRHDLVDGLRDRGRVHSDRVDAAMRAVPRHLFLPGTALARAYADTPVSIKIDGTGAWISSASQPSVVAMMLEQLAVEPGHTVLVPRPERLST